jgi:hypothetical protein
MHAYNDVTLFVSKSGVVHTNKEAHAGGGGISTLFCAGPLLKRLKILYLIYFIIIIIVVGLL